MADNENPDEYAVVKPIEQVTVMLFGSPVRAVRLPDGRIAAVFSDLTDALNLARTSQARRVRSDDAIVDELFLAEIDVDGVGQPMDVLTAWAIPLWLTGIHPGKLTPEKRPKIVAFKRQAADVLYRYFSQPHDSSDALLPALPAPNHERHSGVCTPTRQTYTRRRSRCLD